MDEPLALTSRHLIMSIRRLAHAATIRRLNVRKASGRPLAQSEALFAQKAFSFFDLNSDGKIEMHEVEEAYLHKRAGSEMVKLLYETEALGNKGVTWELLETFDLNHAWRTGALETTGSPPVVTKTHFKAWAAKALETHYKRGDSMEGAQVMHDGQPPHK